MSSFLYHFLQFLFVWVFYFIIGKGYFALIIDTFNITHTTNNLNYKNNKLYLVNKTYHIGYILGLILTLFMIFNLQYIVLFGLIGWLYIFCISIIYGTATTNEICITESNESDTSSEKSEWVTDSETEQ
jgi:hypothetical protein